MMTVSQVARRANVAPNTVRNHVRDYPDLFSEGARGLQGHRLFDDDDVATLCSLVALKNSGMALPDAATRLRVQQAPTVIDADATPLQDAASAQDTPEGAQDAALVLSIQQTAYNALQRQIDAIRHAQEAMQAERVRERRNDKLQGALWGAIAAFAVAAFMVWVLWLVG